MDMLKTCPHKEVCGGCIYQGVPYEEQLKTKENLVFSLFDTAGMKSAQRDPIVKSPELYRYRNKMEYTFGDLVKDGGMTLGMHRPRSFLSIATVDECQLVPEDFNKILRATLDFCLERGYTHYNKKSHTGLMRNLVLRRGVHTNELLIAIVTASDEEGMAFDEAGYLTMIRDMETKLSHKVVGVLRILNDNVADAVKCDELRVLQGERYYNEEILGLKFKVDIFSFFQTNIPAVERLYEDAIDIIDDYENKLVFDLFCGTGTISQAVARRAKEVVGVEIVPEAVSMAKESATLNGLTNVRFYEGDVFEVLETVPDRPDVIIVDPPRPGVGIKTMEKLLSYGVPEMVYVSCNYKTLVRDLAFAEEHGYKVKFIRPYDNFPFTKHVECVVLMSKVKD